MIEYTDSLDGVTPDRLDGFFEGWPDPPTPETHLRMLERAAAVVLAIDTEHGRVVGFMNAISDGILAAYVPLLEVRPEYRGQGIGSELVRRMVARFEHLYMLDLVCDEETAPFYERLGMRWLAGMAVRNFGRSAGDSMEE